MSQEIVLQQRETIKKELAKSVRAVAKVNQAYNAELELYRSLREELSQASTQPVTVDQENERRIIELDTRLREISETRKKLEEERQRLDSERQQRHASRKVINSVQQTKISEVRARYSTQLGRLSHAKSQKIEVEARARVTQEQARYLEFGDQPLNAPLITWPEEDAPPEDATATAAFAEAANVEAEKPINVGAVTQPQENE